MEGGRGFGRNRVNGRRVDALDIARDSLIRASVEDSRDEATRTRDSLTRSSMLDPESEGDLHAFDPVTWLRDAIAIDTQRWASQVSDDELARRYVGGGRYEWHPHIAKGVETHLKGKGYTLIP